MKYDTNYVIAVDFDNTLTCNENSMKFNSIAIKTIKKLKNDNFILILWTCRENKDLEDALKALDEIGITFDYVNEYPLRESIHKINADFYIDDKSWISDIDWDGIYEYVKKERERLRNESITL